MYSTSRVPRLQHRCPTTAYALYLLKTKGIRCLSFYIARDNINRCLEWHHGSNKGSFCSFQKNSRAVEQFSAWASFGASRLRCPPDYQ